MKVILLKVFSLSVLFLAMAVPAYSGLDDLDDLDELAPEEEAQPSKKKKSKVPDYDKEVDTGEKVSKPIPPKSTRKKPQAIPENNKPQNKPLGYVSQKKVKTKGESDKSASKKPVKVKSKGLKAIREKGILELREDVVITQDNLRLTADYAKVFSALKGDKQVEKIFVKGNVKISKSSPIPEERVVARGDQAVFYNKTRKVVLRGNARLWRGSDLLKGKKIDYDMNTGWITVDSAEGVIDPDRGLEP